MGTVAYESIKQSGKLPSPNGVALRILRAVEDNATTISEITAIVETDPAIASRLLKLVNAPLSGASRTIAGISTAIKLLGMRTVKNLALGFSLISSNRGGVARSFDYEGFWSESLARAVVARNLADHFRCCAAEEAFTVALLSHIGRLALATAYPGAYDALLDRLSRCSMSRLAEEERVSFDIDHADLAAEMMTEWGLAGVFCESVRQQISTEPGAAGNPSRVESLCRLLQLSQRAALVLVGKHVYGEDLSELLEAAEGLGFSRDGFNQRFESIQEEWRDVASVFSVHARASPSLRQAHTRASRHHRTILVVDDDPSVCRLLTEYLESAGYEVLTSSNGVQALRQICATGCQLVITDWIMPEMDGLALCRAIRESEGVGFVYIIVLTGRSDPDSLAEAFEAGADDFLTKPCQKQELLARLKAGVRTLTSEARVALQQLAIHRTNAELAMVNQKLQEIASTDELTGLPNRREAMSRLREHWAVADREGWSLACMMLDIDRFKQCNDKYGHDVGDVVLRATARILRNHVRGGEMVFRMGGEEFVVLCLGSSAEKASVGAERLRAAIEANQVTHGGTTHGVTMSIGVADKCDETTNPDDLLKLADEMLYEAKHRGRNRVCTYCVDTSTVGPHCADIHEDRMPERADESTCAKQVHGTILVVDDDPCARRLFRKLLERDGFDVCEACDGIDALSSVRDMRPDVILLDIEMPNMDGLECTRRLKSDAASSDIPVIIVSGKADSMHVRAGLQAGAQEYITKPIVHDEFLLRVRAMSQLQHGKFELLRSNAVRGEQARAMGILFDLSRSLATADGLDAIVTRTANATAELMHSRRVSVMLPDDSGNNLFIASALGIDNRLAAKIRVPAGSAIAGSVFASGNPTVLNSPTDVIDCSGRYESDFFASVPLASKALSFAGKVVGVLNVTERHGREPFEDHEIEYLDLVCNMTASAIEQFQSGQARQHAHAAIVIGLAKLAEHRDRDTGKHLERVTQYALLLARELQNAPGHAATIDDRFLEDLEQAMPLHDIGKVAVPDAVLLKPGPLSDAEFTTIKRHAELGAMAVQSMIDQAPEAGFLVMARDIARSHHEWVDGSGYPQTLRGNEIPLAARIAAVADVYDALTTKRPYKEAFSHEKAVGIIEGAAGAQFDPVVVDAFLGLEQRFAALAKKLADGGVRSPGSVVQAVDVTAHVAPV